jgi:hypothetical protein
VVVLPTVEEVVVEVEVLEVELVLPAEEDVVLVVSVATTSSSPPPQAARSAKDAAIAKVFPEMNRTLYMYILQVLDEMQAAVSLEGDGLLRMPGHHRRC